MGSRTGALPSARPVAAGVLVLLLAGCAASPVGEPSPDEPGTPPSGSAAGRAPTEGGGSPTGHRSAQAGTGAAGSGAAGSGAAGTGHETAGPDTDPPDQGAGAASGSGGTSTRQGGAGLEVPEAPGPTVESLAELLDEQSSAALVTTPLPGAASAVGRLAPGYPQLLRPVRSSTVGSSSISPSGRRLQVALVGTTRLRPQQVLLVLRARLVRRGLTEQPAPPSAPGSVSLAFRRGQSVVTVVVTTAGARASYSIAASLHPGGE